MANLIVAFVMFTITIPSTSAATFLVPERPIDERMSDHGLAKTADGRLADEAVSDVARKDNA
jgi:hypothetical protein